MRRGRRSSAESCSENHLPYWLSGYRRLGYLDRYEVQYRPCLGVCVVPFSVVWGRRADFLF